MRQMLRLFETYEIAAATVRARFNGESLDVVSDEEGYIDIALDGLEADLPERLTWAEVELDLKTTYGSRTKRGNRTKKRLKKTPLPPVRAPVLLPARTAEFAVISDIDDTILKTGATSLFRNLKTTFLNAVEQRVPFLGVSPFYHALQRQGAAFARNPIFYVSSSPWNLHDFLEDFMVLNDIPIGPMMLRDFGLDRSKFIKSGHGEHKLSAIETLLTFYPDLPFILIGDSGQEDAAIYKTVVERHPGRIQAVYIRALREAPERDGHARALLRDVEALGVEALLCPDLMLAAESAADQGWIEDEDVDNVRAMVRERRSQEDK